ncbi:MAG TPA: hypothetical protein VJ951_06775 [Bacteroidales bacterium]|nr:hypothetical protein [Bacteroidales bacterium]
MLLRLLKNNRFGGFLFIIFLMAALWLKSFIAPMPEDDPVQGMPLYDLLFGGLESRRILSSIVSILFYGLLIILVYHLNVIHFLLEGRTIMPSAFFLMVAATFPPALQINPILVSSLFFMLAIITLIRGEEHRAEPLSLFNAALFLAVGSLFYFKILYFIPFLWITASVIRPIQWRGIVNPLLVVIMTGLFHFTYYWVFKNDGSMLLDILRENNIIGGNFENFSVSIWILLGFIFFLVIISSVYIIRRFQVRKIIVRKLYQIFFFLFIYTLLFYVAFSNYSAEIMPIFALPLAFLFSVIFIRKKNRWPYEALLWIWLGLIAYVTIIY